MTTSEKIDEIDTSDIDPEILQAAKDLQPPKLKPQLALARPAKLPLTSYEQGLKRARDMIDRGMRMKEPTNKQSTFIQALTDGATATEAYRFAYDLPHEPPSAIHRRASDLQMLPHVAHGIFIEKQRYQERLLNDRVQAQRFVIEHLQRVVEMPGTHHAARVNALNLLGKYSGLFGEGGGSHHASLGSANGGSDRTQSSLEGELMGKLRVLMGDPSVTIEGSEAIEDRADEPLSDDAEEE